MPQQASWQLFLDTEVLTAVLIIEARPAGGNCRRWQNIDQIELLSNLLEKVDVLVIGGGTANILSLP